MDAIKSKTWKKYDLIVGISRGGTLPGYLISQYLKTPLEIVYLQFRDDTKKPLYDVPKLLKPIDFAFQNKKILLTDDVANSGKTMQKAISLFPSSTITTVVISGNADISLLGPHDQCIEWPWEDKV